MTAENKVKKQKEMLFNDFDVDIFCTEDDGLWRVIKRKDLDDLYFIELSITYNNFKELIAQINIYKKISEPDKNIILGQYIRTVYNLCISKENKFDEAKIIEATKGGEWLDELDLQAKQLTIDLKEGRSIE